MRVLNMVMAAIAGFACAQLAAAWFVWMPQHEAHAYTRGYAAAVDSVRAAATAALEADTLITGWTSKDTTQTFIVVPVRVGRALVSR